jgi:hypothetical protein
MDEVGRFDATKGPRIVGPRYGASVDLGAISARFMVWGEESGGGSSLVEHPIPARSTWMACGTCARSTDCGSRRW